MQCVFLSLLTARSPKLVISLALAATHALAHLTYMPGEDAVVMVHPERNGNARGRSRPMPPPGHACNRCMQIAATRTRAFTCPYHAAGLAHGIAGGVDRRAAARWDLAPTHKDVLFYIFMLCLLGRWLTRIIKKHETASKRRG